MENTKYSSVSNNAIGEWLESSHTINSFSAWNVYSNGYYVKNSIAANANSTGVRPAIEVAKTNIEY